MRNSDYWRIRFLQLEEATEKQSKALLQELEEAYIRAEREIEAQISRWYQRFADNNQITMAEARKLLNSKELAEFKWDVKQYIENGKENALSVQWMKELENASARFHISRLEALRLQIQQSLEALFGNQLDQVDRHLKRTYLDRYYHTAYEVQKGFRIGWDIAGVNDRQLANIIKKPWAVDGLNFSDRIWNNRAKLIQEVHNQLTQNILLGRPPDKAIQAIADKMQTSKYNAGRLVMTESAYFSSLAQKDCFEQLHVEQYELVATLDGRTSEICQEMDGKVFPMKVYEAGVTAPPFHPWCRTVTVPYFEDNYGERAAKDEEGKTYYVPSNMKYKEWKQKYIVEPYEKWYTQFKDEIHTLIKKEYPLTIVAAKQNKHIPGTREFDPNRSTLTADPEELIRLYAGKADPIPTRSKRWSQRERFVHTSKIGIYRDKKYGLELPTSAGIIHYSKRGVHIVPARPPKKGAFKK